MMSFNLVVLAGNAGRDPETKEIEGTTVTSFLFAVDTYISPALCIIPA